MISGPAPDPLFLHYLHPSQPRVHPVEPLEDLDLAFTHVSSPLKIPPSYECEGNRVN